MTPPVHFAHLLSFEQGTSSENANLLVNAEEACVPSSLSLTFLLLHSVTTPALILTSFLKILSYFLVAVSAQGVIFNANEAQQ